MAATNLIPNRGDTAWHTIVTLHPIHGREEVCMVGATLSVCVQLMHRWGGVLCMLAAAMQMVKMVYVALQWARKKLNVVDARHCIFRWVGRSIAHGPNLSAMALLWPYTWAEKVVLEHGVFGGGSRHWT